jgi:hypothetical protein
MGGPAHAVPGDDNRKRFGKAALELTLRTTDKATKRVDEFM